MKKISIVSMLGIALAATVLASGCHWPAFGSSLGDKTGKIMVSVAASQARTVTPDLVNSVASYSLTLASGSSSLTGSATKASPTFTFVDVSTGTWTLSAVAMDATGRALGSGSATVTNLTSGESRAVVVPITFSTAGTGNLSLTVAFPSSLGIDYVQGVINRYASGSTTPTVLATLTPTISTGGASSTATFSATGLPSGAGLDLVMTFRRGGASGSIAGVYTESVNIYDNLTSDKWIDPTGKLASQCSFASTDFFDSNAYLASLVLMTDDPLNGTLGLPSFMTVFDAGNAPSNLVRFSAAPSLPGQIISYTWNGASPILLSTSSASPFYSLQSGQNLLVITVTAPDRMTKKTYTVAVSAGSATTSGASGMKMALVNAGAFLRDTSLASSLSSALADEWLFSNAGLADSIVTNGSLNQNGPLLPVADRSGVASSALSFDGTNYLYSYSGGVINNGSRSVSCWIKTTKVSASGTSGGNVAVSLGYYSGANAAFALDVDSSAWWVYGNGNDLSIAVNKNICDGTWHLATVTYDNASASLSCYVDGSLVGSAPQPTPYATSTGVMVGAWQGYTNYFVGSIDDVRIFNRVLTLSEVQSLASFSMPASCGDVSIVSGFYLGKYEVTQAQWIAVTGQSGYPATMLLDPNTHVPLPDVPITGITWYDMLGFCNLLSAQDGYSPAYAISGWNNTTFPVGVPSAVSVNTGLTNPGYRLPTDSEWQWAMMGGTNDALYSGGGADRAGLMKIFSGDKGTTSSTISTQLSMYAISSYYASYTTLEPVGFVLPNELGIYDMSGNAAEWCWDDSNSLYSGNGLLTNYQGGGGGVNRDVRGGSVNGTFAFTYPGSGALSYFSQLRGWLDPSTSDPYVGFRLARDYAQGQTGGTVGAVIVRPDPGSAAPAIQGPNSVYPGSGAIATFTATGGPFDQYTWYFNGTPLTQTYVYDSGTSTYSPVAVDQSSSGITLMILALPDLYIGPNRLTVVVKKGSSYYSEEITVLCSGGCG